ncbi:Gfo/Idh/MocA family oxidoreductase [Terasakiella sp. A23]|uniref:Gfo/Idh/MocA family protein n=1 Tax=Terasakiella sp. FCG-A23 TaxID=3080561 RepID=UPI002954173A|nr:Gfo/Idh/MocA family oxidoreductase [Terasakiella sp. A23]MDV7341626.1 Gfo/Idh/MocA family oxidoreductase [Terasakiella sp. A23]
MKKYNIGIIGAGNIISARHSKVLAGRPDLNVKWVFDINQENRDQITSLFQRAVAIDNINHELTKNTDAVIMTVPVGVRAGFWSRAFEESWAVFCEKPISLDYEDYTNICSRAKKAKSHLFTGFNRRYYHSTKVIQNLKQQGYLDQLEGIILSDCQVWANVGLVKNTFLSNEKLAGGGVLMETGSHSLDQVANMLDLKAPSIDDVEMSKMVDFGETSISGSSSVEFAGRRIPLTFRYSVSYDAMNGVFLKLPNGYIFIEHAPAAIPEFRSRDLQYLYKMDVSSDGITDVDYACMCQWEDFISKLNLNQEPIDYIKEYDKAEFVVKFIDKAYKAAAN